MLKTFSNRFSAMPETMASLKFKFDRATVTHWATVVTKSLTSIACVTVWRWTSSAVASQLWQRRWQARIYISVCYANQGIESRRLALPPVCIFNAAFYIFVRFIFTFLINKFAGRPILPCKIAPSSRQGRVFAPRKQNAGQQLYSI